MKIHGLSVCVNYADFLAHGIDRWVDGLDTLTLVTDHSDQATVALASDKGCRLHRTNVFYERGATFNKGAAMEEARLQMPWNGWVLFFDPDIVPPADWKQRVIDANPQPGRLYGVKRRECPDPERIGDAALEYAPSDAIGVGFFQLFHTDDPAVNTGGDLLETHWLHAGNYDNGFMRRWHNRDHVDLGFDVWHIGERDNWWGRGNTAAFAAMIAERRRRGGEWKHERIGGEAERQQAHSGAVPGPKP